MDRVGSPARQASVQRQLAALEREIEQKRRGILLSAAIETQKVELDQLEAERLLLSDKDAEKRQQIERLEQELTDLQLSSTSSPLAAIREPAPRETLQVATPKAAQGGRTTPRNPAQQPKVNGPPMPAEPPMPATNITEELMPTGQSKEVRSPLC